MVPAVLVTEMALGVGVGVGVRVGVGSSVGVGGGVGLRAGVRMGVGVGLGVVGGVAVKAGVGVCRARPPKVLPAACPRDRCSGGSKRNLLGHPPLPHPLAHCFLQANTRPPPLYFRRKRKTSALQELENKTKWSYGQADTHTQDDLALGTQASNLVDVRLENVMVSSVARTRP